MSFLKEALAEPIPGYRLIEPLGRGGFSEVWKCEAPGGLFKAIKFVHGDHPGAASAQAEEELRAIERVKAIRHPFLLSMDRVERAEGELVIVGELADKSLHELLVECQQRGLPGIPRDELLGYMREAAEILDVLQTQNRLQHLDVKPRNLFLVGRHVKVGDFGLVQSLNSARVEPGAVTPLYGAPEVLHGRISPRSDQYSLAISYQEMLTGTLPYAGANLRELLLMHTRDEPNLSALPRAERAVVARALAKDPEERYPSCTAFVEALAAFSHGDAPAPPRTPPPAAAPNADTVRAGDTDKVAPRTNTKAMPEVVGYRALAKLGSNPLEDVWKAESQDGKKRVLRFVYGLPGRETGEQEEAVNRLGALHHPLLCRNEVLAHSPGRLVLASEWVEENLRDRFQCCKADGLPGVPRDELLNHLGCAAEALDYLHQQHGVHHLGLNPRNLLLDRGRVRIAEFGLAHLLWVPAGQQIARRNAPYSAPDLFAGKVSSSADQYSLAVIFQELLTGTHPFHGRGRRPSPGGPAVTPDLAALSPADHEVLTRALDPDPQQRWPSCSELVAALRAGPEANAMRKAERFVETLRTTREAPPPPSAPPSHEELRHALSLMVGTASVADLALDESPPELSDTFLRHRFRAGLPVGLAREEVLRFCEQWRGVPLGDDEARIVFRVATPTSFWKRLFGRQPSLEIRVQLTRPNPPAASPVDVAVEIVPVDGGKNGAGARLLEDVGMLLLEGLRAQLLSHSEKRTRGRLPWPHPVRVRCALSGGKLSSALDCRGKDISLSGIGFYLPHEIPTSQVVVELKTGGEPPVVAVPATLVRAQRCADGSYDVGALFRLKASRESLPELDLTT